MKDNLRLINEVVRSVLLLPVKKEMAMWRQATSLVRRLGTGESGLETVEWAIIVGLIVVAALAVMAAIGTWVVAQYQAVQSAVGA